MVTIQEMNEFILRYDSGQFPFLRFGQAFYNAYYDRGFLPHPFPELFNEENREKAEELIWNKFVNM